MTGVLPSLVIRRRIDSKEAGMSSWVPSNLRSSKEPLRTMSRERTKSKRTANFSKSGKRRNRQRKTRPKKKIPTKAKPKREKGNFIVRITPTPIPTIPKTAEWKGISKV
jgi:hypothetical protein